MSFRLPSLVKLPGNKVFDYKPRYYNAAEEERNALIKKRDILQSGDDEAYGKLAKENIKQLYGKRRQDYQRKSNSASNLRLVVIILALLAVSYLLLIY